MSMHRNSDHQTLAELRREIIAAAFMLAAVMFGAALVYYLML
jgi:hypothetical protein